MFNEFQQWLIPAALLVVILLVIFFIVRKKPAAKPHDFGIRREETPEELLPKHTPLMPEFKAEPKPEPVAEPEPKPEPVAEVVPAPQVETVVAPVPPVQEIKPAETTDRRKSDKTIPKRTVPEHLKITKQNFSEFAGERILVAEDNPINQKVIVGLLAGSGIEVVLADDGQEALDILEKDTNFLMILMDAHMPRVDGFEATRIIRTNPLYDHILVVALSGDVAADDIQKMKNAGMSEQLQKPLRMESLYKIIYAYSAKEVPGEESAETSGSNNLDVEEGLQTCGGDKAFYHEILSEFITDYAGSAESLGDLLRTHDFHAADAMLLDIIGVTANIGAGALEETATNLKMALGDTDEKSYFSLFDQYKVQLNRLLHEIREYLVRGM